MRAPSSLTRVPPVVFKPTAKLQFKKKKRNQLILTIHDTSNMYKTEAIQVLAHPERRSVDKRSPATTSHVHGSFCERWSRCHCTDCLASVPVRLSSASWLRYFC